MRRFDVVFTSYGVLCWLPDIQAWARVAARYVKPGGIFYIVDRHPLFDTLWDSPGPDQIAVRHGYFRSSEPTVSDIVDGTYASSASDLKNRLLYEFSHPLGEIVTALADGVCRSSSCTSFRLRPIRRCRACRRQTMGTIVCLRGLRRCRCSSPSERGSR